MGGWPDPLFRDDGEPSLVPWPLSASSVAALRGRSGRLMATVDGAVDLSILDVGRSLASIGSLQRHRVVLLGRDRAELVAGLAGGQAGPVSGVAGDGPGPVFVFPGQGPQWAGMAWELLERSPVFAAGITECARELAPFVDWSLIELLRGEQGDFWLRRDDIVQPAIPMRNHRAGGSGGPRETSAGTSTPNRRSRSTISTGSPRYRFCARTPRCASANWAVPCSGS